MKVARLRMINRFVAHIHWPGACGDTVVQEVPVEEFVHPFDVTVTVERILPQSAESQNISIDGF